MQATKLTYELHLLHVQLASLGMLNRGVKSTSQPRNGGWSCSTLISQHHIVITSRMHKLVALDTIMV